MEQIKFIGSFTDWGFLGLYIDMSTIEEIILPNGHSHLWGAMAKTSTQQDYWVCSTSKDMENLILIEMSDGQQVANYNKLHHV